MVRVQAGRAEPRRRRVAWPAERRGRRPATWLQGQRMRARVRRVPRVLRAVPAALARRVRLDGRWGRAGVRVSERGVRVRLRAAVSGPMAGRAVHRRRVRAVLLRCVLLLQRVLEYRPAG